MNENIVAPTITVPDSVLYGIPLNVDLWDQSLIRITEKKMPVVVNNPRHYQDLICIVTAMRAGTKYMTSYTNMIQTLNQIYGNREYNHVPLEMTIETHTAGTTNQMLVALNSNIMASAAIKNNHDVGIYFGNYKLEGCIVSDANIQLHEGTLGSTVTLSVMGARGDQYYRSTERDNTNDVANIVVPVMMDNLNPSEIYGHCSLEATPLHRNIDKISDSTYTFHHVSLNSMSMSFRENIKMLMGAGMNKYTTIYPPFPKHVSMELNIHLDPELTMTNIPSRVKDYYGHEIEDEAALAASNDREPTLNPMAQLHRWVYPMYKEYQFHIHMPFYGDIYIVPQDVVETHRGDDIVTLAIAGNIKQYIPGRDTYPRIAK